MAFKDFPQVEALASQLKRRQIYGSHRVAIETALVMRSIVSQHRWSHAEALMNIIIEVGKRLVSAQKSEITVGNIVRRVLHLIREEYKEAAEEEAEEEEAENDNELKVPSQRPSRAPSPIDSSMYNLLTETTNVQIDYSIPRYSLKALIIQGINEMIDELENIRNNIASQALEHIHSNEIIITMGHSECVREFLLFAARKRQFQVIVVEAAPYYGGQKLAVALSSAGIDTTLVPDSAVFAMMSRCNKVILGCHAGSPFLLILVTANGGLIAPSGSQMIAYAAKHYSTPVAVLSGIYKLSPTYPIDEDSLNLFLSPQTVCPFKEGVEASTLNPYYDYVDPSLVSLFITNV